MGEPLPAGNCREQLETVSDEERYRLHDRFAEEFDRLLAAGEPETSFDRWLFLFGTHHLEHLNSGFESYLENFLANDLEAEVEAYESLLGAMGAERGLAYLRTARAAFAAGDGSALEALPVDFTDEEDLIFLGMCYLEQHRDRLP